MIKSIMTVSDLIKNGRELRDVLAYSMEEMGELATEVNIVTGFSNKQPGKDGVIGEAIDVILCMVDLICIYSPDITEGELQDICNDKLQKWITNQLEQKND